MVGERLKYSSPWRRRARVLGRYARYAAHPQLLPEGLYVPTYWWDQERNFGDLLTPHLLPGFGIAPIHRLPQFAALVGVGSVLEHLPVDYTGTFWGGGLMFDRDTRFPEATFAAVRGRLSAERLGLGSQVPTGDPGLLLQARRAAALRTGGVVLVPHYRHQADPLWDRLLNYFAPGVRRVDVRARPGEVADQLAHAGLIITSSLHGLITADAHGVPASWTLPRPWGEGGAFKFLDYESNFARTWERQVPTSASSAVFADAAAVSDPRQVDEIRRALVGGLVKAAAAPEWQEFRHRPVLAVAARFRERRYGSDANQWPTSPHMVAPRGE